MPFNKLKMTASFILVSSSLFSFCWLALEKLEGLFPKTLSLLGRNALLLWIMQYVFLWYPIAILSASGEAREEFAYGAVLSGFITLLFCALVVMKNRKYGIYKL